MSSANGLPEAYSASASTQLISIFATCLAFALIPLFLSTVYLYKLGKKKLPQGDLYKTSLPSTPSTILQAAAAEIVDPEKNEPSHPQSVKESEENIEPEVPHDYDWMARNIREDSLENDDQLTMTRRWSSVSDSEIGKRPIESDVEANQGPGVVVAKKCSPPKKPGILTYFSSALDKLTEISEIFNSTVRLEKEPPGQECVDGVTSVVNPPPPPPPPPPKPPSGKCVKKEEEPPPPPESEVKQTPPSSSKEKLLYW